MQLHYMDTARLGYTGDGVHTLIYKDAHHREARRQMGNYSVSLFRGHKARARWIEDQADHIGAGLHPHPRIVNRGDTANLDFGHVYECALYGQSNHG